MRKFLASIFCLPAAFLVFSKNAFADTSSFITIVNPVRISKYTASPTDSLASEYSVIKKYQLPATWLLTYDVIVDDGTASFIKKFDKLQEFGIFLEVSPKLSETAGVVYNDTGFAHHATSVFLSGYTQEERIKLVDAVFKEFKRRFGNFPKSVGSWWTDSYSLTYMQEKYGVSANLGVADQFATDGYQVWGQYWATPFYPSKYHTGIPARNTDVKLDVVNMQWAPRDPLNGYYSSLYSTQDYHIGQVGLSTEYFKKLINLYAEKNNNEFGHIVVGLEGDLEPEAYKGEFEKQMEAVSKLRNSGGFEISTMQDFAIWYREKFTELSPPHLIESADLLGTNKKVFWYQSPAYRVGILYDYETENTKVFDFRTYHPDFQEPYYLTPNREFTLSINIPSYLDEISDNENIWSVSMGKLQNTEGDYRNFSLLFDQGEIRFTPEGIIMDKEVILPEVIKKAPTLEVSLEDNIMAVKPNEKWITPREGIILRDLTSEATHLLGGKKVRLLLLAFSILLLIAFFALLRKKGIGPRLLATAVIAFPIIGGLYWYRTNTQEYYVSQGEADVLFRLSVMPEGQVVVYDRECLQCEYHTEQKPAVFANKRGYVEQLGEHPIVYNLSVFEARTQEEARAEFEKLNAKYIYLSKYGSYIEKIPFSPGDLNIEKVYGNANAEIWRVKDGTQLR